MCEGVCARRDWTTHQATKHLHLMANNPISDSVLAHRLLGCGVQVRVQWTGCPGARAIGDHTHKHTRLNLFQVQTEFNLEKVRLVGVGVGPCVFSRAHTPHRHLTNIPTHKI